MPETAQERLDRAIAGDEDALADALAEHAGALRVRLDPLVPARFRSVLEVDDILQITYLEAFLRIGTFTNNGPAAFFGWLSRVAENNLRDAIRELERQKRPQPQNRVALGNSEQSMCLLLEEIGATTTTPSRNAAAGEMKSALDHALAALPDDYALVIRQYDLEGRDAGDVAKALGRSEGAVYMLRARAHERLREHFSSGGQFFSRPA